MASECESELKISNVSVHIPQNLNWIWSQKGRQLFHKALQIVSNAENETGESSAAQTLCRKLFNIMKIVAMIRYLIFEGKSQCRSTVVFEMFKILNV